MRWCASDIERVLERVETAEDAERLPFIDSPTILVNGWDPFAGAEAFGLTYRVYQTPEGLTRHIWSRKAVPRPVNRAFAVLP